MSGGADIQGDFITLVLFWVAAYVSDLLAQWTRLSALLFYLVIGCIYGNTHLVEHSEPITFIAEVAITFVFFALGFEENVPHFLHGIKKAWGIASIGAIVPFICGFGCAYFFFPDEDINACLICGLAVTATAVSLTMITLKSKGLAISRAAIGIMTSAVLDDVMCLALVAIMVPICTGEAEPSVLGILWIVAKSVIFFLIICFLHVVVFPHDLSKHPILKYVPLVRSHGARDLLSVHDGSQGVVVTILMAFSVGIVALSFGFHPAIGAYMAGLVLAEEYYELPAVQQLTPAADGPDQGGAGEEKEPATVEVGAGNTYESVKDTIDSIAFVWLGPIFFLHLGSQIMIDPELLVKVLWQGIAIYFILLVGQLFSAALSARYVPGGFTWTESWMIGFGMLGRAELFFVVLNIAYLENSIISEEMFFALTIAAMLLNITVPVAISLYKPFYTGEKKLGCCDHDGGGDFLHHPHLPHIPLHLPHIPHIQHPHMPEGHMHMPKMPHVPHPHMPHHVPHPHVPHHMPHPHMPSLHLPHPHMPHALPHPHLPNTSLRPSFQKGHLHRGTTDGMFAHLQKKAMREERAKARRVVQFNSTFDMMHAVYAKKDIEHTDNPGAIDAPVAADTVPGPDTQI